MSESLQAPSLQVQWLDSIDAIDAQSWNALLPDGYPFLRHAFLAALERSGAASVESGWQPRHLLLRRDAEVVAAMPLYRKYHSYGEYVFDWSWADAWQRSGLAYYPKLLCAVPFTPATGPRLLVAPGADTDALRSTLIDTVRQRVHAEELSGFHLLFPDTALAHTGVAESLALREGVQYHWFNRGYADFDDFLAAFSSRKRKNLRKERERVAAQGLTLQVLEGPEISPALWRHFHHFYQLTYAKRSGHGGYLDSDFFEEVGRTLTDAVVMVVAYRRGDIVAAALNFRDDTTLYGRYWGCSQEFEYLHFEACYYQGIDYCIRRGLQRFDPGAQGEHKIQRGFEPVSTWSLHWIEHPALRRAVVDFLERERRDMARYRHEAATLLPFRQDTGNSGH